MSELVHRRPRWTEASERGSVLAIRAVVFITTVFGRPLGRTVAFGVAFYFWMFAPAARRAIRIFRQRLGLSTSAEDTFRSILRFAQTTLDAFFLVAGKIRPFEVRTHGHEHLAALRDGKRGAILLGAHLGSFYAMRAQSEVENLPLYAVVYTKNARRINDALEQIDPGKNAKLIQMGEGVDFVLRIRELVDGGAIVAILADRVPHENADERTVRVPFLGAPASFPAGPYLLASMLRCPVYMTFGLYRGQNRYDLFCEPFAEKIELPRTDRESALQAYVARYAERLAHYAQESPDNWFNFYDFWER